MEISVSSTCPWICVLCPIVSHPKARDHILFIPTPFTTASREPDTQKVVNRAVWGSSCSPLGRSS